jgi:hypothetical protein
MAKDYFGNEICVGDTVVYAEPYSSTGTFKRGTVREIYFGREVILNETRYKPKLAYVIVINEKG